MVRLGNPTFQHRVLDVSLNVNDPQVDTGKPNYVQMKGMWQQVQEFARGRLFNLISFTLVTTWRMMARIDSEYRSKNRLGEWE